MMSSIKIEGKINKCKLLDKPDVKASNKINDASSLKEEALKMAE